MLQFAPLFTMRGSDCAEVHVYARVLAHEHVREVNQEGLSLIVIGSLLELRPTFSDVKLATSIHVLAAVDNTSIPPFRLLPASR